MVLFLAAMQVAPPVIDPVLDPAEARAGEDAPAQERVVPEPSAVPEASRRLLRCLAMDDPQAAIAEGARWLLEDGGIEAELCVGVGYEGAGQWAEAEQAYLRAAALAETQDDARRPAILASAARMALARGEAEEAKTRFDQVLSEDGFGDAVRGGVLMDRARAHMMLGDGNAAQLDLVAAQALLPNAPAVWLLSATLARRQGNLDTAGDFIDRALELDRTDPATLLEAGNIAIRMNAVGVARQAWGQAAQNDPEGQAGQAATRNIEQLDGLLASGPTAPVEGLEGLEIEDDEPETGEPDG